MDEAFSDPDTNETNATNEALMCRLHLDTDKRLAAFVLHGTSLIEVDQYTIRRVLAALAGAKQLNDPEVLKRYHTLNKWLHAPPGAEKRSFDELKRTPVAQLRQRLVSRFRHPEAQCASPQDHDEAVHQAHVEAFFPELGQSTNEAISKCTGCLAIEQCLVFAVNNNVQFGIWGGTSPGNRKKIQRLVKDGQTENATALVTEIWKKRDIEREFQGTFVYSETEEADHEELTEQPAEDQDVA